MYTIHEGLTKDAASTTRLGFRFFFVVIHIQSPRFSVTLNEGGTIEHLEAVIKR